MSQRQPDPAEPPEGFETRPSSHPEGFETRPTSESFLDEGDRPDWLVGAGDVLEGEQEAPARLKISEVPAKPQGLKVVAGGAKPNPPKAWTGAASSVPKLSVVPAQDKMPSPLEDEDNVEMPGPEPGGASLLGAPDEPEAKRPAEPAFRPLEEPWYLVWFEALLTNRTVQVAGLVVVAAVAAFMFWPKPGGASGASLGSILRHPERFEGHTVAVRGEVLESFEVGQGHAFQLRQGRDVVVIYSTLREPRIHETINVVGIVSTGYLDGAPRVAIFEGSGP